MKIHSDIRYQRLISEIEAYHISDNIEKLKETLEQLQTLAETEQDSVGLCAAYFYRGILSDIDGNTKDNFTYLEKSNALAVAKKIPYYEMKTCNSLGVFYSEEADFYTSLKNYLKACHIADEHPEYHYKSIVLNNIGNLFVWLHEYEAAIIYLEQAYNKYIEDQLDDHLIHVVLIVNLVEMYSEIKDYKKVDFWMSKKSNACFTDDESLILDCILIVNDIVKATGLENYELAKIKTEEFLCMAAKTNDFIYVFRSYLKILNAALSFQDEPLCARLIQNMQILNDNAPMATFFYDFAAAKVHYQKLYHLHRDTDINADFYFYYLQSSSKIKQLEHTYALSLFAEIELDKSRFENKSILKQNRQLQKNMELDTFTGLYNKASTIKHVEQQLSKRSTKAMQAMMVVDIDYFKNVNDFYGHDYGDIIINQIADFLKEIPIAQKIVGRFGGDEYMVFFPYLRNKDSLKETLHNLLEKVHNIPLPDNQIEMLTLSIGIGLSNQTLSFEQFFKIADQALYDAKRQGRNRYEINDLTDCQGILP